jgi:hypothetical protein
VSGTVARLSFSEVVEQGQDAEPPRSASDTIPRFAPEIAATYVDGSQILGVAVDRALHCRIEEYRLQETVCKRIIRVFI